VWGLVWLIPQTPSSINLPSAGARCKVLPSSFYQFGSDEDVRKTLSPP